MDEILRALRLDQSDITQTNYSRIIAALEVLGYTGRPEKWHTNKMKVKVVLPEKVRWFMDNPGNADADQIRTALEEGGVYV
jgi:hypothetical protein